jgi:3-oxoacyl-[acyl-carrier-protein] synthase II
VTSPAGQGRRPEEPAWQVAVTGWSLHVPGADLAAAMPALAAADPRLAGEPACPPEAAHELLGRKGLLNKDPATRLALCAVHRALRLPAGTGRSSGAPDPGVAVVASSNLGNLATVASIVADVRAGRRKDISPLAAPGASSNVLASAVATWFGFGGPGFMLCSGPGSGTDALATGALLLRAGRAARVVVVGAEPEDETAAAVGPPGLRAGSACVVLEPAGRETAAPRLRPAGPGLAARHASWAADLLAACGDLYGALGVARAAVAAALVAAGGSGPVRVAGPDSGDGWRELEIGPIR